MRIVNPRDQIQLGSISTSRTELVDLIKAWVAISLAFAILFKSSFLSSDFFNVFIFSSITVGLGFIAHEMAHKVVAQRYGCTAEFRAWDSMLIMAVVMSFFGLVIAAPGAVMISGPVGKRRNGKISAAGAIANLVVALLFLSILLISAKGALFSIARYGFMINTWLALFNMIPFWMFDGKKVLEWNRAVYFIMLVVAVGFMILNNIIFA